MVPLIDLILILCLIRFFCRGKCNVHSPRSTCGATRADLLAASTQPVTSPHACAEVGNQLDKEKRTTIMPVTRLPKFLIDSNQL